MAKISKASVDKDLRERIFTMIKDGQVDELEKINDRQYGMIMTDLNGDKRYVRVGAIVAEMREDMTAEELMQSEITAYNAKQDEKEVKRLKKIQKIASDKAKREAEAKEKSNDSKE